MTDLVRPDVARYATWAATVEEFDGGPMDGSGSWMLGRGRLGTTHDDCQRFVARLLTQDVDDPPPAANAGPGAQTVRCTFCWITDGEPGSGTGEMVGFLALRHDVPGWLHEWGGHIGYSVRPSRRREGHAGRALGLALRRAGELGIDPVLLTCDPENDGSRRTIESRGGVYEDTREGKFRYWVPVPR